MDTGHASCQFNSAWMHDDNDDDDKTGERDGRNENEEAEKKKYKRMWREKWLSRNANDNLRTPRAMM